MKSKMLILITILGVLVYCSADAKKEVNWKTKVISVLSEYGPKGSPTFYPIYTSFESNFEQQRKRDKCIRK